MVCVVRGEAGSRGGRLPAIIEAVFYWCAGTKGDYPLSKALEHLANGIGVDAIAVSRTRRGQETGSRAVFFDARHSEHSPRRLNTSFAGSFLSEYLSIARPGTTWFQSAIGLPAHPELESFQRGRGYREFGVIPLEVTDRASDILELHFSGTSTPEQHTTANLLAGTLSDAWASRSKGIFTQQVLATAPAKARDVDATSLLSAENPARLSRSEYRVCVMLANGVAPSALCMELSISRSTLRSHLRNIYAKTGAENMPDLLCLLLKDTQAAAPVAAHMVA